MLSQTMRDTLIEQIKIEWESEFYYLAMMAWCYNNDLDGYGDWFMKQAEEEREHGMRIARFISEVGAELAIPSINAPEARFENIEHCFKLTLEHEEFVTHAVHQIVDLALKEHDYTTNNFMQWYVNEQVEEEATARLILGRVRRAQGNPSALFIVETQLTEGKLKAGAFVNGGD